MLSLGKNKLFSFIRRWNKFNQADFSCPHPTFILFFLSLSFSSVFKKQIQKRFSPLFSPTGHSLPAIITFWDNPWQNVKNLGELMKILRVSSGHCSYPLWARPYWGICWVSEKIGLMINREQNLDSKIYIWIPSLWLPVVSPDTITIPLTFIFSAENRVLTTSTQRGLWRLNEKIQSSVWESVVCLYNHVYTNVTLGSWFKRLPHSKLLQFIHSLRSEVGK